MKKKKKITKKKTFTLVMDIAVLDHRLHEQFSDCLPCAKGDCGALRKNVRNKKRESENWEWGRGE